MLCPYVVHHFASFVLNFIYLLHLLMLIINIQIIIYYHNYFLSSGSYFSIYFYYICCTFIFSPIIITTPSPSSILIGYKGISYFPCLNICLFPTIFSIFGVLELINVVKSGPHLNYILHFYITISGLFANYFLLSLSSQ